MIRGALISLTLVLCASFSNAQELVWSDEFEQGESIDESKWLMALGNGCPDLCGWGNNELQSYTNLNKNVRVENGKLIIEAHQDTTAGYTSAKLESNFKGTGRWKFGRIDVRAKLPSGKGTWPAIWMLPVDWKYGGWPKSGEIDIMEHVGYEQNVVHGTVHTESFNHMLGTQIGKAIELKKVSEDFHVYSVIWSENEIIFLADDIEYNRFKKESDSPKAWPFDQDFYLILNIAVGGNWGGKEGVDNNIWPQKMEIDYVRVYQ